MENTKYVSRQIFFKEDNLFTLLNVVHDTIQNHQLFDKRQNRDRKLLFEVMTTLYTNENHQTLTQLNKRVLQIMYQRIMKQQKTLTPNTSTRKHPTQDGSMVQTIRDADIHNRPVPSQFPERPQASSVSPHDDVNNTIETSMKQFEKDRAIDTQAQPKSIEFTEEIQTDNTDVESKMDSILKQRENDEQMPKTTAEQPSMSLSSAITDFQTMSNQFDANVEEATQTRMNQQQQREDVFSENTQYNTNEAVLRGESITGEQVVNTIQSVNNIQQPLNNELEKQLTDTQQILQNDVQTRLDTDVQMTKEMVNTKLDEREFQKQLHMDNEEEALAQYMSEDITGIQEEILIPSRSKYVNTVHYLEINSCDRVRALSSKETPYCFTVYFNSNRPSIREYAMYDVHFLEDPDEYVLSDNGCNVFLDTIQVRKKKGLRGLPIDLDEYPEINNAHTPTYEIVELNQIVAGPNVDTVFYNVIALKTNHVQVYFPYDEAPVHPYILLDIQQFSNVYRSSNQNIRKSFCKLFYDRSSAPTTGKALYHTYIPMNNEKKIFNSPLSSIDRLNFALYDSCGNALDTIKDVHHVRKITFHEKPKDYGTTEISICIVLNQHVQQKHFSEHNTIVFDNCLEWYNKEWFTNWFDDIGQELLDEQKELQCKYANKLANCEGLSAQDIQCIKDEFESSQVDFDFPTRGYIVNGNESVIDELRKLHTHVTRPCGHRVKHVGTFDNNGFAIIPEDDTESYINSICIDTIIDVDTDTGLITHWISHSLKSLLDDHATNPLITAKLYNQSVSTNISMSVITRDDENVILNKNI